MTANSNPFNLEVGRTYWLDQEGDQKVLLLKTVNGRRLTGFLLDTPETCPRSNQTRLSFGGGKKQTLHELFYNRHKKFNGSIEHELPEALVYFSRSKGK